MNRDEMLKEAQTFLDNGDLDKAKEFLTEVRRLDASNEKAKVEEEPKDKDEIKDEEIKEEKIKEEKQEPKKEEDEEPQEDDEEPENVV